MTSRRGSDGVGSVGAAKKVLVNVTVERSLGRVQVVTSPDTRLEDLIKAVIEIYVKEKMRPLLTQTHPHHFDLHYSQFTFECLDPNKELKDTGARRRTAAARDGGSEERGTAREGAREAGKRGGGGERGGARARERGEAAGTPAGTVGARTGVSETARTVEVEVCTYARTAREGSEYASGERDGGAGARDAGGDGGITDLGEARGDQMGKKSKRGRGFLVIYTGLEVVTLGHDFLCIEVVTRGRRLL
ncbi:hypothetical protein Scep_006319 [Stephania cephalantha]|uniref:DUF7054 domain-containing protein n=1 Tax=Stephania cephalantha TaxID=152367 RepID=A0AAP0PKQ3_9MAGN